MSELEQRVRRLQRELTEHSYRYYVLDAPTISGRRVRRALSRAAAARVRPPGAFEPRLTDEAGRRSSTGRLRPGTPPQPDGLARQRLRRRRAHRVRRAGEAAARLTRSRGRRLRGRAEDRRPRHRALLQRRTARGREHARRRQHRRRRHRQCPYRRLDPAAPAPERARAPGSTGRGLPTQRRLPRAEPRARGGGRAALRQPTQCRCRLTPAARSGGHRGATPARHLLRPLQHPARPWPAGPAWRVRCLARRARLRRRSTRASAMAQPR